MGARAGWAAPLAAAVIFGVAACNSITGAGDITIADADDDAGGGGETAGAGGAGPGASVGPGAGAGPGAGSGGSTGSGTGGDPGPTACVWPAGPYGVGQGQTLPPTISWQGYGPGESAPRTVSIEEFFDCDGTHGVDAVLFDTSQFG